MILTTAIPVFLFLLPKLAGRRLNYGLPIFIETGYV